MLPGFQGLPLTKPPHVVRFLRGLALKNPQNIDRFPTWRLNTVLTALTKPPFEPAHTPEASVDEDNFPHSNHFGEKGFRAALSFRSDLCIFHKDKAVLCTDVTFIPNVSSRFHRSQEIFLPSFCPNPVHPREKVWHTVDVKHILKHYIHSTGHIEKSEALFINISQSHTGR